MNNDKRASANNPIYEASAKERLLDLKRAVELALTFEQLASDAGFDELQKPATQDDFDREGMKPGEFALGNWIIRPRVAPSELTAARNERQ